MRNRREVDSYTPSELLPIEQKKFLLFLLFLLTSFLLTQPVKAVSELTAPLKETVLAFTGDVMLGRYVNTMILKEMDPTWPFVHVRSVLQAADISLINLETPILENCPQKELVMVFCTPQENIVGLTYAGIDIANLANNHRLDQGEAGYQETLRLLQDAGIFASDEDHLVIIEKNGTRFGFLGFNLIKQSDVMKIKSKALILSSLEQAKSNTDVLVVSMHWGNEYQQKPPEVIVKYAHDIIDAGANVIVGNHPHVLQRSETYHDGIIFYSLGNTVFDQKQLETRKGQMILLTFEGEKRTDLKVIPTLIEDGGQPRLAK